MRRTNHSTTREPETRKSTGLARAISKLGFCSRAQAAQLIRDGKVRLNGALRCDPESSVHLGQDRIEVDGHLLRAAEKIYLVLNKPHGAVTTASDERGRETVFAYLPAHTPWCSPVGRLDRASEGLLLFTNDTAWANRVTDPETHLEKTYHVQIAALADEPLLARLHAGVRTDPGEKLSAKRASVLRRGERNSWLEIVLDEGKNRQIRRLLEAQNIEVLRLIRVAIGPLEVGELAKGSARRLTPQEKLTLDRAMRKNQA